MQADYYPATLLVMEFFIGNLPYDMTEHDLRNVFQQYGKVSSVTIPTDLFTGQPKGLAFVTVEAEPEKKPVESIHQVKVKGRVLSVEPIDINYITDVLPKKKKSDTSEPQESAD
jgi:RNA recognition motif-containing protein